MKKLLQINICSNIFSTGKICEDIAKTAQANGWETYIAYGNSHTPSISTEYKIAGKWNKYLHYIEYKLFDREGLGSRFATLRLINWICKVNPDIVHLHNIHDHWLNYPLLFNYLAEANKPVVWTQHDCWSFTGGCMYFDLLDCNNWQSGCLNCPDKRGVFCNRSRKNYNLKTGLFNKVPNLTFIPVSDWLAGLIRKSVLNNRKIITIHNGIDTQKFHPLHKEFKEVGFSILGVAAVWDARKGLKDFIELRRILPMEIEITLVGLSSRQVNELPLGINGITKTSKIEELVELYNNADIFVNPTYSDNFPTTNIEALACGTPVITYNTGGSPESIDSRTGVVIKTGDVKALASTILKMRETPFSAEACRERAVSYFERNKCYEDYINIYNNLIRKEINT